MSKYSSRVKRLINRYVTKWKQKLYLGSWSIDVEYGFYSEEDPTRVAETETKFGYMLARITFFLTAIESREMSDAKVEQWVVHEMVHILLAGHQHFMRDGHEATLGLMERETQLVTYALIGLDRGSI